MYANTAADSPLRAVAAAHCNYPLCAVYLNLPSLTRVKVNEGFSGSRVSVSPN